MLTLGIETSCDETAASIVADGTTVRSSIVAAQVVHSRYGGVVPELASRAHARLILPVVKTALEVAGIGLEELDLVAATCAPGLLGALLVGLPFAKALAWSQGLPFVGVNHLEGHIFAVYLHNPTIHHPFIALIVSGGHTELILVEERCRYRPLGVTLDDACGEAFDKAAKMLGFPYPGGAFIEQQARQGRPVVHFPEPKIAGLDFSFSGLKTALLYYLRDIGFLVPGRTGQLGDQALADISCSFQEVLIDCLVHKLSQAVTETGIRSIAVTGGVAVNRRLRDRLDQLAREHGLVLCVPAATLCTDNAAMIAACGYERYKLFGPSSPELAASARAELGPGS
ncbi:MAG: tRNA (adenosine(37)-N6)-threonylcarbamoyltransferase complex transferase subunit TsaD [candidate division WOR-3 bacterium]